MPIASPFTLLAGSHVWVALEGATLSDSANVIKPSGDVGSYTVAGSTAKPSSSDTAWVKLGRLEKVSVKRDDGDTIEIWTPAPGHLALSDMIRVAQKRTWDVTCVDVQALSVQLALRTLALNTFSTQFNPGEGANSFKGWVKFQTYTAKDVEAFRIEFWADLDIKDGLDFDPKKKTDSNYTFTELYNVLNTGTIPNSLS